MKKSFGSKVPVYPVPVWCIGSFDVDSKPNVMTVTWAGIASGDPASVTISLRKERLTYSNIMLTQCYTVNVPSKKYIREADYFGMVSGRDINKFEVTGLTPEKANNVNAPYVKEFPMNLECQVIHAYDVGLYTQIVGEIVDVKLDESILGDNQVPDMNKLNPILYTAENRLYHELSGNTHKAYELGAFFQKRFD